MSEPLSTEELEAIRARHAGAEGLAEYLPLLIAEWEGEDSRISDESFALIVRELGARGNTSFFVHSHDDVARLLDETEGRPSVSDVDLFLRRERDEYEPHGMHWNVVDDVLDAFRLHVITGTPLTDPRPHGGPEPSGVGPEPLTEAEELRAEVVRLRRVMTSAFEDLERCKTSDAEQTLREALYIEAVPE